MNARLCSIVASLPIAVYVRDQFFGLCTIQGSSMQPNLEDGDVLLVQKFDYQTMTPRRRRHLNDNNNDDDDDDTVAVYDEWVERETARRFERLQGIATGARPPTAIAGDVVVYKNPSVPDELVIKRVMGVGGQWLRHEYSQQQKRDTSGGSREQQRVYDYRMTALPPYTIFTEGDSKRNSIDGRLTGPISKNLMVGVALAVVWPPWRWRRVECQPEKDNDGNPRAVWY